MLLYNFVAFQPYPELLATGDWLLATDNWRLATAFMLFCNQYQYERLASYFELEIQRNAFQRGNLSSGAPNKSIH